MRKKDYELIGDAFRYGNTIPADENQLYWVADFLASKLERNYPEFDRQKFLTACGIDTHEHEWQSYDMTCKGCGVAYAEA